MRPAQPALLRHPLGRWVDPAVAFATLHGAAQNAFWLDSSAGGRFSYIGASDSVLGGPGVFDELRAGLVARHVPDVGGAPLGWVGWLGYELRAQTMGVPVTRASRYPDAALLAVDRCVSFDHESGEAQLLALGDEWTPELAAWRDAVIAALESPVTIAPLAAPPSTAVWRDTAAEYIEMVEACQRSIRAGDAYQLCLTTEASVDVRPDPFATYLALRASSPSHHGAFLRVGGVSLLSASPEQFLSVSPGGIVESRPIKGTRPRGATPEEDEALRDELLASDKERAENLMIVDLMRNDIGRIARVGSVSVPSLLAVETYPHVHQLVSTVRGELAEGLTGVDAVVATFPAGSMTGAPKHSATLILDVLEQHARGIYAGAFGLFSVDGTIDLAMVIRSIVIDPAGCTIGAGGGITALSEPTEELAEVRLKAAALLHVLGATPIE